MVVDAVSFCPWQGGVVDRFLVTLTFAAPDEQSSKPPSLSEELAEEERHVKALLKAQRRSSDDDDRSRPKRWEGAAGAMFGKWEVQVLCPMQVVCSLL
jgi:hypothetical protein